MTDLADKKCIPCEGGIPGFKISEIHKYLKMVDGWEVKADPFFPARRSVGRTAGVGVREAVGSSRVG